MKKLIVSFLLSLFFVSPAWALSCAVPEFNEAVIDSAAAVFEGKALEIVPPTTRCVGMVGKRCRDEGAEKKVVYRFGVQFGWKGASPGFVAYVETNEEWGSFKIGETYLVVASGKRDEVFLNPLCGHTMPVEFAEEKLKVVEQWCLKNKCTPSK